jgi:glycosyltransferase involved in cell wall biosynthesis
MEPRENPNLLFTRALEQFRAQHFAEADELVDRLLEAMGDQPVLFNLKAAIAYETSRPEQALPWQWRAVNLAPHIATYWCNLGQILGSLGRDEEARACLEQGLELALRQAGRMEDADEPVALRLARHLRHASAEFLQSYSPYFERYRMLVDSTAHIGNIRHRLLAELEGWKMEDILGQQDVEKRWNICVTVLDLLGFVVHGNPDWNQLIANRIVYPWLEEALAKKEYDLALLLEYELDIRYVHQHETERHFTTFYRRWIPPLLEAARGIRATLPSPAHVAPPRPRVAIVVHNLDLQGPNEVILSLVKELPRLEDPAPKFVIYVLNLAPAHCQETFTRAGAEVVVLQQAFPEHQHAPFKLLLELRKTLAERGTDALLWSSTMANMAFAFGLRLAPVQIWWSHKYHAISFEEIDGYLTGGSITAFRPIGDRLWRSHGLGKTDWFAPELTPQAQKIRTEKFSEYDVVIGTLAREEKMTAEFFEVICRVLKDHPRVAFIFAGRSQRADLQEILASHGVERQTAYLGWIDTKLYAQVLDIFVDTFPFPNGISLYQAVAAGKPAVLFNSIEANATGLVAFVRPVLAGKTGSTEEQEQINGIFTTTDGSSLFPLADSPAEYERLLRQLVTDPIYRRNVGRAMKEFVDTYMSNPTRMANLAIGHILDIIREKRYPA